MVKSILLFFFCIKYGTDKFPTNDNTIKIGYFDFEVVASLLRNNSFLTTNRARGVSQNFLRIFRKFQFSQ